jgi:hypothetical protein
MSRLHAWRGIFDVWGGTWCPYSHIEQSHPDIFLRNLIATGSYPRHAFMLLCSWGELSNAYNLASLITFPCVPPLSSIQMPKIMLTAFLALFLALSVSANLKPAKRDASTVVVDIAAILAQTANLNNTITTFSNNPTLTNALVCSVSVHQRALHAYSPQAVHSGAVPLDSAIAQATTDTQTSAAFDETDGSAILNSLKAWQPQIISVLQNLNAQHAKFAALPLGGESALIAADLDTLNSDTTNFENALTAVFPVRCLVVGPVQT